EDPDEAVAAEPEPPIPGIETYLAYVDGRPVARGTAAFSAHGVPLFGGATLPDARRRGPHRRLVAARWDDAVAARKPAPGPPAGARDARRALGYLAELFRFPGWASASEVLSLHQRLAGSDGGARERAELLELVGLADAHDTRVAAMSKGMQQRLGIAQALIGT